MKTHVCDGCPRCAPYFYPGRSGPSERKHSSAQRAYWARIRRIMSRHGLTMKEARTMYRVVMARVAREVAAARRFLSDGPRRLPCPRYRKGCHSSSHMIPHHHVQRSLPW